VDGGTPDCLYVGYQLGIVAAIWPRLRRSPSKRTGANRVFSLLLHHRSVARREARHHPRNLSNSVSSIRERSEFENHTARCSHSCTRNRAWIGNETYGVSPTPTQGSHLAIRGWRLRAGGNRRWDSRGRRDVHYEVAAGLARCDRHRGDGSGDRCHRLPRKGPPPKTGGELGARSVQLSAG
jgi:hypothetical protein